MIDSCGTAGAEIQSLESKDACIAPIYARFTDRVFVDGRGASLFDSNGERFLDMTSGIGVLALGHGSTIVQNAMRDAASRPVHTSNLFLTEPPLRLAKALTRSSFADCVFFGNSGTEANEAAIKFARVAMPPGRHTIVYFDGSFHGRTYASLAATDRLNDADEFGPLPTGFRRAKWNDSAAMAAIDGSVAAVLAEPVQGEGGVRPADPAWLQRVAARCKEVGALLILDEVQCGVGRTGSLWAYEQMGVTPDLLTVAKPLAGGLPIGAVLMTGDVAATLTPGCHGSTFGGGPAVTNVAHSVLNEIAAPGFLAEVRRKGALLLALLRNVSSPIIAGVRGMGLMLGVQVSGSAKDIVRSAVDEHLLVTAAGDNVVRFLPPLNVSDDVLRDAVNRFETTLTKAVGQK